MTPMVTAMHPAPEGWTWVETATPGEIRLMRLGTGWPTLCLLNGDLNVIHPREQTTNIPRAVLEALFNRAQDHGQPPT
jgi:hypothetical protein